MALGVAFKNAGKLEEAELLYRDILEKSQTMPRSAPI